MTLIGENAGWSKRARGSTRERFSPSRVLSEVWALQWDRWILWLPVAMIVGAAVWLLAPADPDWWFGPLLLVAAAASAIDLAVWPGGDPGGFAARLRSLGGAILGVCIALGLGFRAAEFRGWTVAQTAYVGLEEAVRVER